MGAELRCMHEEKRLEEVQQRQQRAWLRVGVGVGVRVGVRVRVGVGVRVRVGVRIGVRVGVRAAKGLGLGFSSRAPGCDEMQCNLHQYRTWLGLGLGSGSGLGSGCQGSSAAIAFLMVR